MIKPDTGNSDASDAVPPGWSDRWAGVKMSRGEVRSIMARAAIKGFTRGGVDSLYEELGKVK